MAAEQRDGDASHTLLHFVVIECERLCADELAVIAQACGVGDGLWGQALQRLLLQQHLDPLRRLVGEQHFADGRGVQRHALAHRHADAQAAFRLDGCRDRGVVAIEHRENDGLVELPHQRLNMGLRRLAEGGIVRDPVAEVGKEHSELEPPLVATTQRADVGQSQQQPVGRRCRHAELSARLPWP